MATIGLPLTAPETGWNRFDDTLAQFSYDVGWSNTSSETCYNGSRRYTTSANMSVKFNFIGSKLRIIGYTSTALSLSTNTEVIIDGDTNVVTQMSYTGGGNQGLWFEITGLENKEHIVVIKKIDAGKYIYFDAIDIDESGSLLPYSILAGHCKNSVNAVVSIADYVWCKYTAVSGVAGSFSELGAKEDADVAGLTIPTPAIATSNGYFRFIFVGYDTQGRKKFVADKTLQSSITWPALNNSGYLFGVDKKINNVDCVIRSLTGTAATIAADTDDEYDKIIVQSTLNGAITAGDNSVWNWQNQHTICVANGNNSPDKTCCAMGYSTADFRYGALLYTDVFATVGFRPVLLVEDNVETYFLFKKEDNTVYKYNGTELEQVSADWATATDADKKTAFLAASQALPSASILSTLGKFKIMEFAANVSSFTAPTATVNSIPKKRIILPTKLISMANFENIDSAVVTGTFSGGGELRLLVTTDLATYKTFNTTSGAWETVDHTNAETVATNGMTHTAFASVTAEQWILLTNGAEGVGFAYLPTITAVSDSCTNDSVTLTVDMKGAWNKAVHGTDYTYGYPSNVSLKVTLLTDGSYKINYYEPVDS